jgi:NitT/TauT family transport system permease protein
VSEIAGPSAALRGSAAAPPRPRMRIVNRKLSRLNALLLGAIPFLALLIAYVVASDLRRRDNPADKLLPSLEAMGTSFLRLATEPEVRTGDLTLWVDTFDSLQRLGAGLSVSVILALCLGMAIGFVPHVRAALAPFVAAISLIPPITVLPILFIALGLGEAAKIMLIVVGTAPVMIRSVAQAVMEIPEEQIIKAETLGASTWQMILRVVLPQIWPRLFTIIRLALVPAWIFLISAEAIASTGGLGYRIFLVRRYLAMDVILPYVAWITLIAYVLDRVLLVASKRLFAWAHLKGDAL